MWVGEISVARLGPGANSVEGAWKPVIRGLGRSRDLPWVRPAPLIPSQQNIHAGPGGEAAAPGPFFSAFVHKKAGLARGSGNEAIDDQTGGMNATDLDLLRAFYVSSRQQLYTYAVSITGNRETAEDAIHGVFEHLLRGGRLPLEVRPYVFRAVRNAAFDAQRRARVRTDAMFLAAEATGSDGHGAVGAARPDDLETLLHGLPPDEREAIVLKTYGDLTFQQIADLRGVPLATASSWYRRGLEHLRAMVKTEA